APRRAALRVAAARGERAIVPPEVVRLPSAPDEVLFTAPGPLDDATLALVRAAQSLSRALGSRGFSDLGAGLAEVPIAEGEDGKKRALGAAAVRSSTLATVGQ